MDIPERGPKPAGEARPTVDVMAGVVLLVDDDPLFLELTRKVLQKAGYQVLSATDGVEAVKLYSSAYKEIGLVLSDISMPRMNGGDAMKLMRNVNPAVKVILISGHLEESKRMLMLNAGANECFTKPDQAESLLEHVQRYLSPGFPGTERQTS
jgi:CheY-like chemotaxis protein